MHQNLHSFYLFYFSPLSLPPFSFSGFYNVSTRQLWRSLFAKGCRVTGQKLILHCRIDFCWKYIYHKLKKKISGWGQNIISLFIMFNLPCKHSRSARRISTFCMRWGISPTSVSSVKWDQVTNSTWGGSLGYLVYICWAFDDTLHMSVAQFVFA